MCQSGIWAHDAVVVVVTRQSISHCGVTGHPKFNELAEVLVGSDASHDLLLQLWEGPGAGFGDGVGLLAPCLGFPWALLGPQLFMATAWLPLVW